MRLIFCVLLTIIALSSCAQAKPAVKKTYAYLLVTHMGMIAVDESGNPTSNGVDSTYKIFIEVPAEAKAKIDEAVIHNHSYTIQATSEAKGAMQVGVSKFNNQPLFITPSKGNKLIALQLSGSRRLVAGKTTSKQPITISGTLNNKKFAAGSDKVIELKPILGQ